MYRLLTTIGLVLFASLTAIAPLHAVDRQWDSGGADNNFNTKENWSGDTVPVAADTAYVENGGTALISQNNAVTKLLVGNTANTTGHVQLTGGTITISSNFILGYYDNGVGTVRQSGGKLAVSATSNQWSRFGYGTNSSYGFYELTDGIVEVPGIICGNSGTATTPSSGVFNQSGGSVTADSTVITDPPGLRFGTNNGALGAYNLTGGTSYARNLYAGGTGASAQGQGQVNISGTGVLTIAPSGSYAGLVRLGYANGTSLSDGAVNLGTGGIFKAPMMRSGGGTEATVGRGYLNFHGGTLVTNADQTDYLQYMNAYVYDKDARIDTDGHTVTFNRAILAATDYGVDTIPLTAYGSNYVGPPVVKITGGSGTGAMAIATLTGNTVTGITITNPGSGYKTSDTLTVALYGGGGSGAVLGTAQVTANTATGGLAKLGLGKLTLNAVNTYTGETLISAGTFALGTSGSIASSSSINVGADSFFDVSAIDFTLAGTQVLKGNGTVTGNVTTAAGSSVAPGASIGALTVNGNVNLDGSWDVEYDGTDPESDPIDLLTVSGTLDLDGATLNFHDISSPLGQPLGGPAYVFATYGMLTGTPAAVNNLPAGYSIDYTYGENHNCIALIPEPSVMALLGLLAVCSLGARRRD